MSRNHPQGPASRSADLFAQAVGLHQQGFVAEAERLYHLVLADDKKHVGALQYLAMLEGQRGNLAEAVRLLRRCVKADPRSAEAQTNLGYALALMGRHEEAVAAYDRALAINRSFLTALNNRGISLRDLGRFQDAIASFERALAIKPDYADALYNRGNLLNRMNRWTEAVASFDQALAIAPNDPWTLISRATALRAVGRLSEALSSLDKALAIAPNDVRGLVDRGHVLSDLRSYQEAIDCLEKAISIEPGERDAHGKLAWASAAICDWDRLNAIAASLRARIKDGRSICEPFALLGLCDDAELHLICVNAVLGKGISAPSQVGTLASRPRDSASDRLRIAYLSSDFRRHPTANLITGLLEHHDRSRFLVEAVSIGQDDGSAERKRIISAVDTFIDAADKSDNEIAELIRKHRIDILVDLNGLARGGRLGLLAQRPASVQVNYLGYPGSVGANLADYVIADKIILPADRQQFYSEQIIRLPDYYVAYDPLVADIPPAPPRHEAGLPESGFVFCCFNNNFKICETVFSIWMRLLRSVPDSVLWLFQDTPAVMVNLRKHASARGVDPSRLVFAERVSLGEHLARHRLADLFLDTLPYNAHTTACDALWMGLPLVTCAGQAFAGRVGASLLAGVRLPELVTVSHDDYEALALKLATDPLLLHSYRERLTENRASAPPFDAGRLSRQIEAAYSRISEIFQSGEKPRGFTVEQT